MNICPPSIITMGVAASGIGDVHNGHRVTLMNFLSTLQKYGEADGLLVIEDREHSYIGKKTMKCGVNKKTLSKIRTNINKNIYEIALYLSPKCFNTIINRVQILCMSDFFQLNLTNTTNGADAIIQMVKKSILENTLLNNFGDSSAVSTLDQVIKPLSLDLLSTPKRNNLYQIYINEKKILVDNGIYYDHRHRFGFDVEMLKNTNWSIHYLLTGAFRDLALTSHGKYKKASLLHIFGGDYNSSYGENGVTHVERISAFVKSLTDAKIQYVTGPILLRNGVKISKSIGNNKGEDLSMKTLHSMVKSNQYHFDLSQPLSFSN